MSKHLAQAEALSARAGQAVAARRLDEAESLLRRALKLAPGEAALWCNLGSVQGMAGHLDEAERSFRRASQLAPSLGDIWTNLGRIQLMRGDFASAEADARKGAQLAPNSAVAAKTLGDVLLCQGRADAAALELGRALTLRPDWVEALNSLSSALKQTDRLVEAVAVCRRSLALAPTDTAARNLVLALTYLPDCGDDELFQAQSDWAARVMPLPGGGLPPPANSPDPMRRLRVGYLSADFRNHPVARNVIEVLRHHDRAEVEVFAYAHLPAPDELSREIESLVDGWRDITRINDRQAARLIHDDGIDILVSLAGWTGDNRPGICAWRPAAVQVSYHDVGSSALPVMDAWLTDEALHPGHTTERFSERLIRLPCFYLHAPIADLPPVSPLPAGTDGPITFASFNNPVKVTPPMLDLWARVLAAVPESRMMLKYAAAFADAAMRERFIQAFASRGVAAERLVFGQDRLPRPEHLALYQQVDVALDTFPFNGSTTSFEALTMGVPVVTLAGGRFVSRVGISLLTALGLEDLAAQDADGFVALAAALCADRQKLAALRAGLRQRVQSSPLLDAPTYTRHLENAFRDLWRQWCSAA
ncbi:hypothetical protein A6A04_17925 [Paramagnetospirillum marisnigri]|uniref:protein O-GlcNAc transferase n=1 Tax=Paramagnetospirillum marisnigri TaxID=1285242 RepID=A0A178MPR3_9PROT|nr:tetratricopeptide repeat protein [Paramagnetospirillum marisnigri]OAN50581.1 hypothetical protein A6A04_17925 [Paramagnetospirillum marisnigri]